MSGDLDLIWMLLLHLALTAAPGVAATLLAVRAGVRAMPLLLGVALAASGASALLTFWAFFADPLLGQVLAFVVVLGSAQAIAWVLYEGVDRDLLRRLAVPAALWALGSAFILFLGFLHGGQGDPLQTAATRFSHQLPGDNVLPLYFADWFYDHGHERPIPMYVDWLSSDRPPLQIGYTMAQRPFAWDGAGLHYTVTGVIVQQFWIVAMWAVLCAARLRPAARGLAIFAAMVCDIAILHGFFVWPKLLAATFVLAALALAISPRWSSWRRDPWVAALFAALCGLALLSHGASIFALVPLLGFAALRGMPSRRWLGVAALVGFLLMAPWTAFQRYVDPPGDRLLKWSLAGKTEINNEGAREVIFDAYGEVGPGGAIENKWTNVKAVVGFDEARNQVDLAVNQVLDGEIEAAVANLRGLRFFHLLPMLGIFLLGPIAMAVARVRGSPEGPEWKFALSALGFCLASTLFWSLAMFGNAESRPVIHVGAMVVPLLAICACVVGLYAVRPGLAVALVAVNSVATLLLYVPALTPPADTSYSPLAALLATAALAGFGYFCFRPQPGGDTPRRD